MTLTVPTCETLAKRKIKRCSLVDGFLEIEIDDVAGTLYVKESLGLRPIYQTISEQIYDWQWHFYEEIGTRVEDDVVFDCGCAEGVFPLLCRKRASKIVCFEPLPEFLEGLRKTFTDDTKIKIEPMALGDKKADMFLQRNGIASFLTERSTDTPVKVTTIDAYCQATQCKVSYIKADLEGHEINLLNGALETIRAFRPKIAITTYHCPSHAEDIRAILKRVNPGYKIHLKGIEENAGAPVMLHAW